MKQVNVRLTPELIKTVKKMALEEDISFQSFVTDAIESYVAIKLGNKQPINEEKQDKQAINIASYNANPLHDFILGQVIEGLNDPEMQKIVIYPQTMDVVLDSAPPLPESTMETYYGKVQEPEPLSRLDVDPLEMLPEEEWKARLEELKRDRGEL
jgi:hypothetical protein